MVITTRMKKELVENLSSYAPKTTLEDISNIGPVFIDRGAGKKIVKKLEQKLSKDDLKYVYFYFQEELGLMSNDFFWVAAISMITSVEDALRKYVLSKIERDDKPIEKLETMGLGQLKNELKTSLPPGIISDIERINNIRKILVHNNAIEAKDELKTAQEHGCKINTDLAALIEKNALKK